MEFAGQAYGTYFAAEGSQITIEWDPTATSDMEALASVFDSNGDGVLDANDAEFANFKLMLTNAEVFSIHSLV